MNAIDCHFHIGGWKEPEGLSSCLDDLTSLIESGCLGGAAVMTTDTLDNEALLAEVKKAKKEELYFFYWGLPDNRDDTDFIAGSGDVSGVKIHPSLSRKPLTDRGYAGILGAANERGLPVLVHCGRWEEVSGFRFVLDAADSYRNARFIVGHFGGQEIKPRKGLIDEMERRRPDNVYIDIAEMTDIWLVERAVARVGSERLLLGSDYPFSHPSMYIALVNALATSKEEKENILWRNITKLLKREE